ncbi:MAG TPA: NAD(P)/FAD-dependent oxidoreductase [Bacillota bacterium]|nr:NAD(P)/FAD-dependent oxidoreductase [Bacillota bacterium]
MDKVYDVAIIGCGPAGLEAAINCKVRNKEPLFLGVDLCSVKLHKSPVIFNYLGIPEVKGEELRQSFLQHAAKLGVEPTKDKAEAVYPLEGEFAIKCKEGEYRAKTVIIATGISFDQTIPGEQEYLGKGVGYCATCDGPLYRDKTVAIMAYGNEAEGEARFLAEICKKVYLVALYSEVGQLPENVQVIKEEKPKEIKGDNFVKQLVLTNQTLDVDGIFILRETVPPTQLIAGLEMDGPHIQVDTSMRTNIPGIYAAGDCTGKPYQLSRAAGQGQVAALHAVGYLDKLH